MHPLCSPEPVLKPPRHVLEVSHTARPGRLSALGLQPPLVRAKSGRGITALPTSYAYRVINQFWNDGHEKEPTLVLSVKGAIATTPAERVGLGVALTVDVMHEGTQDDEQIGVGRVEKENLPKGRST